MHTSRRLVLATAAVVLGLSACGSGNSSIGAPTASTVTVTTLAGPKVIALGPGGYSAAPASAAPASAAVAGADEATKMIANLQFVFDGALPVLPEKGAAWQYPESYTADQTRMATIAAALGITGPLRTVPVDQGGGWAGGAADYSGPTISFAADAQGSWSFSGGPGSSATVSSCAVAVPPEVPVPTDVPTPGGSTDGSAPVGSTPVGSTPVGSTPDTVSCPPQPNPPVGVPEEQASLSKAKELFSLLGYDPAAFDFEYFGDSWSANVTAYMLLDGQRSPVAMSVSFGADGVISWASGSLATPVPADPYPLAGVQAGINRLNDRTQRWMGLGGGYATPMAAGTPVAAAGTGTAEASSGTATPGNAGVTTNVAGAATNAGPAVEPSVEPSVVAEPIPCGGPATDCAPIDTTPITVHLTGATLGLTMVWDAANNLWLLPAYTFSSADGGSYTVLAVADQYLDLPAEPPAPVPVPEPLPPVTVDPMPGETVAPPPAPTPSADPAPSPDPATLNPAAATSALVGLTEDAAAAAAQSNGWTLRVVKRDGVDLAATADYSPSRVNVEVTSGVVVAVQSIG